MNFKRNYLVIEMEPQDLIVEREPIEIIEEKDPGLIIDMTEPLPEADTVSTKVKINLEEQLVKEDVAATVPPELSALDPNDFSSEYFKPVNVVFVLDVSSSMRNSSKMELMKYSLYTLVKMLRPEDRIGIIKYGSILHLDCHLTVPWYFNVHEAHHEIEILDEMVKDEFGSSVELFVHTDGCLEFSCKLCQVKNCPERKFDCIETIPWTISNISTNRKHRIA